LGNNGLENLGELAHGLMFMCTNKNL